MAKNVKEYCKASLLSCERYTELASRSLETPLSFKEKLQFWSHHILCMVCRRFRRQLLFIEKATKNYESLFTDDSSNENLGNAHLSQKAKEKIQSEISKQV